MIAWKSKNSGVMILRLLGKETPEVTDRRQNIGLITQNNPLNMGDLKINEMVCASQRKPGKRAISA